MVLTYIFNTTLIEIQMVNLTESKQQFSVKNYFSRSRTYPKILFMYKNKEFLVFYCHILRFTYYNNNLFSNNYSFDENIEPSKI
jgi:hypothetical protein